MGRAGTIFCHGSAKVKAQQAKLMPHLSGHGDGPEPEFINNHVKEWDRFVWGLAPWHDASQVSQRLSCWKAWFRLFLRESLDRLNVSFMTRAWNLQVSRDLLMRFLWGLQRVKQVFHQKDYRLGCTPSQDASHHQVDIIFLVGDPYKPSFATVTGRGDNPNYRCPSTLSSVLSKIRKMHADENCVCQHENSVSSHCDVIQSHMHVIGGYEPWTLWRLWTILI